MQILKRWLFKPQIDHENCVFCKIAQKRQEIFHYEDEKYLVLSDIQHASAVQHLLVITKQHIDNALTVEEPKIIQEMHEIGKKVLTDLCQKKGIEKSFRFGFHLPPFNSVDHIHLHCFVQPLSSWKYNKVVYGMMFNSVQDTLKKLQKNRQ